MSIRILNHRIGVPVEQSGQVEDLRTVSLPLAVAYFLIFSYVPLYSSFWVALLYNTVSHIVSYKKMRRIKSEVQLQSVFIQFWKC